VQAKLKAGQPITIVTMGDSLTDFAHWANREVNWPTLLQTQLKEKYNSQVNIVNPAIGGTELRQNLIMLPRWTSKHPAPDLVTVFFGFNDWSSGMRGESFYAAQKDAIDRIRRATGGKADVLILTSAPTLENGTTFAELAEACQVRGLDVTITTTAQTDAEAFALLAALGMPFARDGRPAGFETLDSEPVPA